MFGTGVQSDRGDATLSVKFDFEGELPSPSDEPNYIILETDYDNYSIFYRCDELFWGWASFDYLWILSRTPTMSD